eukprot:jgi/Ulvmu1/5976/UM026_0100.1
MYDRPHARPDRTARAAGVYRHDMPRHACSHGCGADVSRHFVSAGQLTCVLDHAYGLVIRASHLEEFSRGSRQLTERSPEHRALQLQRYMWTADRPAPQPQQLQYARPYPNPA